MQTTALAGAGLWIARAPLWAFQQTPLGLRKFITPLPGLGPTGIPVASANTKLYKGVDYYRIRVGEYRQDFHPDFHSIYDPVYGGPGKFPGTKLWGYADITAGQAPNHRYLGGLIIAQRDRPVRLSVVNALTDSSGNPLPHPLPVDLTIPGAETGLAENRVAVHLHGGHVPWMSDGGPFHWFGSDGTTGPSLVPWLPDVSGTLTTDLWYPNDQSARLMWYHDHAHDLTRINAYAGIATGYLVLDNTELAMMTSGMLPPLDRTIPLILQEKAFVPTTGNDPGGRGEPGDLWYASLYEKNGPDANPNPTGRWEWGGDTFPRAGFLQPPVPSCIPEFYGDTTIVNGMAYPYLEVQRKVYRFLILNATQARVYNLALYYSDPHDRTTVRMTNDAQGNPIPNIKWAGPPIVQIGTEGGFLPAPVVFNRPPVPIGFNTDPNSPTFGNANRYEILLAPAERADLLIDFSDVPSNATLILYSDAPAPFPGGDIRNDYFTGAPDNTAIGGAPPSQPGYGPDTRALLQFRVLPGPPRGQSVPLVLPPLDPPPFRGFERIPAWVSAPNPNAALPARSGIARVRDLTLNESFDAQGRLIQKIGTNVQTGIEPDGTSLEFGRFYMDPATETPSVGEVEVWRIFNLTGDTHPIHFHLVNVQIIARQAFDTENYAGTPGFVGPPVPPDPNERGWKETVRMNPGECTTVIMKFDRPAIPKTVTGSNGQAFPVDYPTSTRDGVKGTYEYVYHCHILEHEEHDMMRPLAVKP